MKGFPTKEGAFHPGGVFGHTGKGDTIPDKVFIALVLPTAGNHGFKSGELFQRFFDGAADDLLRHHRGGSLADGTPFRLVGYIGDGVAILGQSDAERELVRQLSYSAKLINAQFVLPVGSPSNLQKQYNYMFVVFCRVNHRGTCRTVNLKTKSQSTC